MKHRTEGNLLVVRGEEGEEALSNIGRAFAESGWLSAVILGEWECSRTLSSRFSRETGSTGRKRLPDRSSSSRLDASTGLQSLVLE